MLGGGPAGAAASLLLAKWGHAVQLITRPPVSRGLAVSLPPSCGKLFDAIGVSDAIERAGFLRSTGNTVWWGGGDARVETFADGARGWQVDVDALAEVMLDQRDRRRRRASNESTVTELDAVHRRRFVLDCTGRAGVIARATGLRQFDEGPRTIALVGEWRRDGGWPVPDDTHTLIESYDDGWMWSVPIAPGVRHIAAMVDPQRSRSGPRRIVGGCLSCRDREDARVQQLIDGASVLIDGPRGFDASPYRASAYAGERWLLVGDAGSFIDPLSSAGVKKALASAWLAAIAVHTALTNAVDARARVRVLLRARDRDRAAPVAREPALPRRRRGRTSTAPFWDERSDDGDRAEDEDRAQIRRAFERLQGARARGSRGSGPSISIQPRPMHSRPRDRPRAASSSRSIIRGASAMCAASTWWRWSSSRRASRQVPDLYETYVQRAGSAALHDFLFARGNGGCAGWLVSE